VPHGFDSRNPVLYLTEMKLLIATRNRHKVDEIKAILGNQHEYFTLADFPSSPTIAEDANTFEGNATRKAVGIAEWLATRNSGVDYVLADDSGLEVDALHGAPGVHSARFAALESGANGNSSDAANNEKLLRLMAGVPAERRTARFRCVIALTPVCQAISRTASPACSATEHELATELFSGACEGRILERSKGTKGFGYDPLFVPHGFSETFAELGEEQKNRISHRANALAKLKSRLG
jgi:XTP/dITP diphosphohydrolase